ncbi:MAG: hypothetical protein M0Q91_18420 [Methanoregula sp.]|jgi:hypothetical protein|nr:hypothetical protein [Methanoregula sp.]
MSFIKTCLIIAVILIGIAVAVTLPDLVSQYQDPHQNDPDYCDQYARQQEWRTTIGSDEAVNPKVAERVCECKWMHDSNRWMYKDWVDCVRR